MRKCSIRPLPAFAVSTGQSFSFSSSLTSIVLCLAAACTLARPCLAGSAAVRNGKWILTGSMGVERIAPTATLLLDGRVLVVKGTATASAEIYDPSSGNWVQTASANPSLVSHTATLLSNETVLVAGGAEIRQSWTGAAIYDPANGTWLRASRLRVLQEYSSTATLLLDGRVLLAGGGTYDGQILADCELYLSR